MQDIAALRKEYTKAELDSSRIDKNPLKQFSMWFQEAIQSKVAEPNAMHLATVNQDGRPSGRIVLLKGLVADKFQFYSNYQSQKAKDLDSNTACALTFFWPELERQIRVEGTASRVSLQQSDEYFQSRPRGSQLGAWSSPQSSIIKDRIILEERMTKMELKFENVDPIPRPHQWGGYEVDAFKIEFWQGRPNRLHDRMRYTKVDNAWLVHRLAP
jgi:pyridoxamine 5'-phosphate oxidase